MVFFTCNGCGTSLKKNQVERHTFKCRRYEFVTCVDCSKDFWGNEYSAHTSCLTENQKYGGRDYVSEENKGQKKQEVWLEFLQSTIASQNLQGQLRGLFDHILQYDNVPRKKPKFMNFMKGHCRNPHLLDEAWEVFEDAQNKYNAQNAAKTANINGSNTISQTVENDPETPDKPQKLGKKERRAEKEKKRNKEKGVSEDENIEKPKKKSKKRKNDEEEDIANQENEEPKKKKSKKKKLKEQENEEPESQDNEEMDIEDNPTKVSPFKWKKAITTVLREAPEEGMKMKKFKRKLFALYLESKADSSKPMSENEIEALIQKKLKMRNDKYTVNKDRVKLRSSD